MTPFKHAKSSLHLAAVVTLTAALAACASNGDVSTDANTNTKNQPGPARLIGGHSLEVFIGAYDVDRDGVVTRAEYDSVLQGQFRNADSNGDGVLNEAEYVAEFETRFKGQMQRDGRALSENDQAMVMKQAHRRFRIIDANGDGSITPDEAQANADSAYRRWDANGDGVINPADKRDSKMQRTGGAAHGAGGSDAGRGIDRFIVNYDINGDSVVTRAEYNQVREQRFAAADANKDGWLSEAEYVKEFEQRLRAETRTVGMHSDGDVFARQIKQAHRRYRLLDTNGDGRLTKAEALARADQTFQSSDRNRDGAVTRADGQVPSAMSGGEGPSLGVTDFLATYDEKGQGSVTRAQYDQLRQQRFAAADVDRNGWLSPDEYVAEYADRLLAQRHQRTGRKLDAQKRDAALKQARNRFDVLDTNKDGRLSKEEALALADRFFRKADLNGDGVVNGADKSLQARGSHTHKAPGRMSPHGAAGNAGSYSKVKPVQHKQK